MKRLGYIFIVAGLLGVAFCFGSLIHPILSSSANIQQAAGTHFDTEGDDQAIGVAQRFICGIGGGMLAIVVGAYICSFGERKKDEHDMA